MPLQVSVTSAMPPAMWALRANDRLPATGGVVVVVVVVVLVTIPLTSPTAAVAPEVSAVNQSVSARTGGDVIPGLVVGGRREREARRKREVGDRAVRRVELTDPADVAPASGNHRSPSGPTVIDVRTSPEGTPAE